MFKLKFLYCLLALAVIGLFASCESKLETETQKMVVGQLAPDFVLDDLKGKTWKLADLKGKVVLVKFWATWCPPCREEMPTLEALYQSMPREEFEILAILTNDDPRLAERFVQRAGVTFPILIDPDSKVAASYGVTGVPETFIVDPYGMLREKFIGGRPWDSPMARKLVSIQ